MGDSLTVKLALADAEGEALIVSDDDIDVDALCDCEADWLRETDADALCDCDTEVDDVALSEKLTVAESLAVSLCVRETDGDALSLAL